MNPEEAVRAHLDITDAGRGLMVPIHWATFRLAPHPWSEPAERLVDGRRRRGGAHRGARSPVQRVRSPDVDIRPVVAAVDRAERYGADHESTGPGRPRSRCRSRSSPGAVPTAPRRRSRGASTTPPESGLRRAAAPGARDAAAGERGGRTRWRKLDGMAEDLMAKSGIPGMAVAVVHGGKTLYAKGFGVKDVRNGDGPDNKVDPDTVFQLASLSKPLGATVVAHQVGRARSAGTPRSSSKLPWFALSDPAVTQMVTVGDMYSHRSGLPDHAGDLLEDLGYDRRQVLERAARLPLDPFRISYAYTNFGLTAGAEAVAVAAGKSWEDLSRGRAATRRWACRRRARVRRLRGQRRPGCRAHPRRRRVRPRLCARRAGRSTRRRGQQSR